MQLNYPIVVWLLLLMLNWMIMQQPLVYSTIVLHDCDHSLSIVQFHFILSALPFLDKSSLAKLIIKGLVYSASSIYRIASLSIRDTS